MITVLNPVQEPAAKAVARQGKLASLNGKTVGLYDNGKLNAARLLDLIAGELATDAAFAIRTGHYHPERLMDDHEWGDVDACDVVILANGDCGACSSSGIANAIALERRGVPAFLISTPPFTEAVATMTRLNGMPEIAWGIVEHPIGSADEAGVRNRAKAAAAQFRAAMLGEDAAATREAVAA